MNTLSLLPNVQAFTGFVAIDHTHHTTEKLAVEHSKTVLIQAEVEKQFPGVEIVMPSGEKVELSKFVLANRDFLFKLLQVEVSTRKPRSDKNKPKRAAKAAAAPAEQPGQPSAPSAQPDPVIQQPATAPVAAPAAQPAAAPTPEAAVAAASASVALEPSATVAVAAPAAAAIAPSGDVDLTSLLAGVGTVAA